MTDLAGTRLGKYQIISLLGQGGMAQVYKAHHPVLDRTVAIKIMRSHIAAQQQFLQVFEREAMAVARLRHPNIVQVYDFDVADGMHYMVMEFVDGPTLSAEFARRTRQNQPYSLRETVTIVDGLASAVGYAHTRGVVHRDLKPDNTMFTPEGQVVLTDFGIAHLMTAAGANASELIVGTPAYMSPEQAQGLPLDGRCDIYTLGIIIYELVTGSKPFTGNTSGEIILKHISEPIPPPTTINPALPPAVEQVIITATNKAPDDRFQTAEEIAQALRDAVGVGDTHHPVMLRSTPATHQTGSVPEARPTIRLEIPPCPYRGLFAFREEDAPFFFGREETTDRLVDAVEQQSAIAIVGPSGSGKSSVVMAGLLPHLRQASNLRQAQGNAWIISTMRPGARPFAALAAAVLPHLEPQHKDADQVHASNKLAQVLEQGSTTIAQVATQIVQQDPHASRILLVIDQFEELYTLVTDAPQRQRFLDGLLAAIAPGPDGTPSVFKLVVTLRADFVGQAVSYRPVADLLQKSALILGPMNRHELSQAIINPARKVGVSFEEGLVSRILDDVGNEPGNLPLLEFALTLLWEQHESGQLTHSGYDAIGQVEGALAHYANSVYETLSDSEQQQARRVFTQLVHPGEGTEDTRRVTRATELSGNDWALAQHMADARLVVTGRDATSQETVEVVHEALIRGWNRLRDWMQTDRAFRTWQERLRAALLQWEASEQDEGGLLRGAPLAEAEAWLDERASQMSSQEQDYIRASIALRECDIAARERSRRRVVIGSLVATVVMAVLLLATGLLWNQTEAQRKELITAVAESQASQATAEAERDRAEQQTNIATARRLAAHADTLRDKQFDLSLLLGLQAHTITSTVESRSSLLNGLLASPNISTTLRRHTDDVYSVDFSPDGTILASGSCSDWDQTARCTNGEVLLWDVATRQTIGSPLYAHTTDVSYVAFNSDGSLLASGSVDGSIVLWDMATHQPVGEPLQAHTRHVEELLFTPDGQFLISLGEHIVIWEIATRQPVGEPLLPPFSIANGIALNPAGTILASANASKDVTLWDVATRQPILTTTQAHANMVDSIAFSPDGTIIASGDMGGSIILWDVATGQPLGDAMQAHTAEVKSLAFSPDGQVLVSGSWDRSIALWDVAAREQIGESLIAHAARVTSVGFSPDGHTVASSSFDNSVILWDIANRQLLSPPLTVHSEPVRSIAFSPDSQHMVSGSWDNTMTLWDVAAQQPLTTTAHPHTEKILSVQFESSGAEFTSAAMDGSVVQWDSTTGQPVGEPRFAVELSGAQSVALSPDGTIVAFGSDAIYLWNRETGQPIDEPLTSHANGIESLAFSLDGQVLASGDWDGNIFLWDVASRQLLIDSPLQAPTGVVMSLVFSPDGQIMASGNGDGSIVLWDMVMHKHMGDPLQAHANGVRTLAFSPDGQILVSGGLDGDVTLWDVSTFQPISEQFTTHTGGVMSVVFSPDGKTMASGGADGSIFLWDMDVGMWKSRTCFIANRNLTWTEWQQYMGENTPYAQTCPNLPADKSVPIDEEL